MAYIAEPQSTFGNLFGFATRAIASIRDNAKKRRVMRVTMRELSSLSARDLNDLGIDRSMIKSVAYQAAYGK